MNVSPLPGRNGHSATDEPLVELVDDRGRTYDLVPKLAAHQPPGQLHRAISVFLVDSAGRLLLQRRASSKYHSGGLWSNTCCSHPAPGETPIVAAARRVGEELGIEPVDLAEVGTIAYGVTDPVSGLVEREWNHLFVGRALQDPSPDPSEVEDCASVPLDELVRVAGGAAFTAWFPVVLAAVLPSLRALDGERPRS
ncbi:MAG TPA: isopentenyl-diphosphate Delta-isomerase [Actinomycetes bacterium]|jgi:isopentenyl-diphosphate delta-isomerase|nr:isopentenyl-diphosphate Delta-isomerase [Actinomycetes bacterium]